MPVVSEPSERLIDAVVELLVSDGYEGISIRRVASAAGVSIGAVQHHFPTKDALLTAAMERVEERFRQRLGRRVDAGASPPEVLRAVADELLGAGRERRSASVVWLVRLARAAVHEPTAAQHRREWQEVEDLLAHLVRGARPDLDEGSARDEATALLALLDGLASALVVEPARVTDERGRALLERHLDALLAPTAARAAPG